MENKGTLDKRKVIIVSVIILFIFVIAIYTVMHLVQNQSNVAVVTNGVLSQEENVNGYIVRDETVVKGKNYKNGMVKIKSEGERVAKGDSIFRYYSSGEEDIKDKIKKLDVEIQQIMQNQDGVFNSDIKLLESQIEKELDNVYGANSIQKIQDAKKNISSYISRKAKISGEYSPSGSYLKQLLAQKSEYEQKLNENSEYIDATISGVVSYRVDEKYTNGLEHVAFGMVLLPTGKMSTREGTSVKLSELLNESISRAKAIIEEKNPDLKNKDEVARKVGVGAVIFNDLANSRIKDEIFDWDTILNFQGETGPYIQYTWRFL